MSDEVRYDLVDFEGSIQNSSNIESNIDELAKSISNFRSSLDPRINEYYSDLKRLDYCKNDLSNDVSNVNNFSKWLQDGYHEYEEVAHQTEAMANSIGGDSSGSSGFSGSSGGVGGFASTAAGLSPLSSTELNGVKGNAISDIKSTNPFISTDMEKFKTDSSAAKAVEGLSNTSKSTNYGTGVGLSGSTGAAAIGAGLGAATAGVGAITGASGGFGTSSTGSSENLSGQTYNGESYGSNTSAHGELNHILGKEDDEDDDKKKDDVDISTNIAKDAKDKVDKIISKTKKVIPNLHTTSVGDSSGTGTSVAGGVAAGLGGLGAIGAVGGGLAYANNKMNTEEDEEDEDDENEDDEDDEELGDYDKKDKDKSNEKDESSNKEWLYGLGIGLGAAGMAKKIKDDKDKNHDENKNSNQ